MTEETEPVECPYCGGTSDVEIWYDEKMNAVVKSGHCTYCGQDMTGLILDDEDDFDVAG